MWQSRLGSDRRSSHLGDERDWRYVVRVQASLDKSAGLLKWTFTTPDPSTNLPPSDPTIGFLPPDTDGAVGQGGVTLNVAPLAAYQTTGAKITNGATVVFDANAPILTPV